MKKLLFVLLITSLSTNALAAGSNCSKGVKNTTGVVGGVLGGVLAIGTACAGGASVGFSLFSSFLRHPSLFGAATGCAVGSAYVIATGAVGVIEGAAAGHRAGEELSQMICDDK